jgi:hypothetical protein
MPCEHSMVAGWVKTCYWNTNRIKGIFLCLLCAATLTGAITSTGSRAVPSDSWCARFETGDDATPQQGGIARSHEAADEMNERVPCSASRIHG